MVSEDEHLITDKHGKIWKRESADGRARFEVWNVPSTRNLIATVDFIGNEIAYRYYSYEFEDVQNKSQAVDKAIAWAAGAHELYDELNELALIDETIDWGDPMFEI